MKARGSVAMLAALVSLMGCASSSGTGPWTHAGLSPTQSQERMLECQQLAAAAEQQYLADNVRGGANSTTPLINNLNERQRAMSLRTQTYEECLRGAGFTRQ